MLHSTWDPAYHLLDELFERESTGSGLHQGSAELVRKTLVAMAS